MGEDPVTMEIPAKDTPSQGGHSLPPVFGSLPHGPPEQVEPACAALQGLAAALRSHGVEAQEDGVRGLVAAGPPTRVQNALLRPHRGHLWWWMRWPLPEDVPPMPSGVPISPATRTSDAVRRIVDALSRSGEDT